MSKNTRLPPAPAPLSPQDLETLAALVAKRLSQEALPQFLDEYEAAKLVGLTNRSLQAMRYEGKGPAFVKLGDHPRAPGPLQQG